MQFSAIRKFGDPVLSMVAGEVERVDERVVGLVERMFAAMYNAGGIGLAAPQIGVRERVFVYNVNGVTGAAINPVITHRAGSVPSNEGCLSIPDHFFDLERSAEVTLRGLDLDGEQIELEATGLMAMMIQHEVDHLDGVLILNRAPDSQAKRARRELTLGPE
jgi:peptide deformylase